MSRPMITPGVEVSGAVVLAVVNMMGAFRSLALDVLEKNQISEPRPNRWYNLKDWLASFDSILADVGPNTLSQIGRQLAGTAPIPHHIDNLQDAFAALDGAYHSQHRGGEIGHYLYISTGKRSGTMISTTVYPPEFDQGLLTALAMRFEPDGLIDIRPDPDSESRRSGGDSCTFLISW